MEKLFVFDVETTGLDPVRNDIHQLAFRIYVKDKLIEKGDIKMRPLNPDSIDEAALSVSGVTREQVMSYPQTIIGYQQLMYKLSMHVIKFDRQDKFHLVGYNNRRFDDGFLRELFMKCGDKYFGSWFWSDSIDVMVLLSFLHRWERSEITDFKLKTLAQFHGIAIDESKLHDADYDLELTVNLLDVVKKTMK